MSLLINAYRFGAAAFDPLSLSPALWLKADGTLWQDSARTTPATSDSHSVGSWDDASGNGRHVTASGSGRPTLKTAIVNGKPVIRFDGDDALTRTGVAATTLAASGEDCTIVFVQKQDSTQANNTTVSWNGADVNNRILVHATFGDVIYFDMPNATGGSGRLSVAQPVGWDNNFKLVTLMRSQASQVIRVDRAQLTAQDPSAVSISGSGTLIIGDASSPTPLKGDLAELLVIPSFLNATDRDNLETYLRDKYGTT